VYCIDAYFARVLLTKLQPLQREEREGRGEEREGRGEERG
jgi:hypothetical protein